MFFLFTRKREFVSKRPVSSCSRLIGAVARLDLLEGGVNHEARAARGGGGSGGMLSCKILKLGSLK